METWTGYRTTSYHFPKRGLNIASPSGIVDQSVFDALEQFASNFPINFHKLKCPCGVCEGFGQGQFKNHYREKSLSCVAF
jgi:hypothetical protein